MLNKPDGFSISLQIKSLALKLYLSAHTFPLCEFLRAYEGEWVCEREIGAFMSAKAAAKRLYRLVSTVKALQCIPILSLSLSLSL